MAGHSCGNTGSPAGPFQMQAYEAADYRNVYARTMELASYNQLFPEHASFALPAMETGGRDAGSSQTVPGFIPPVLLKAIAWIESGWAQASYDPFVPYGEVGPTLVSHDCGYGIMQVTSGMQNITGVPNLDQAMIGGHYAFNIARGARILADKWNQAPEFRPLVAYRDLTVIENWYYALWSYNGFAFKNHPLNPTYDPNRPPYSCGPAEDGLGHNRGAYPYQELVLGCAAHPPVRGGALLWSPIEVSLPNRADPAFAGPLSLANWEPCGLSLACAAMDLPPPAPSHYDAAVAGVAREHVLGVPVLAVSALSFGLDALPGGESFTRKANISNSGTGVLAWRATASAPWLNIDRRQGVANGADLGLVSADVSFYANASGLAPGTYTAEVVIESLYALSVPQTISLTLSVSLQVGQSLAGDFSGDGKTDLVFLCCADYAFLWISNGSGSVTASTFRPWPGYGMTLGSWQAGDFNGDGRTDLVHLTPFDYANVWLSNGDGGFSVATFRPWPGYGMTLGSWQAGDFNGDGRTDLVHLTPFDYANVWLSNGDGGFSVATFQPWPGYGMTLGSWQAGDFNGDGRTDLLHICCRYAHIWHSQGNASFAVSTFP